MPLDEWYIGFSVGLLLFASVPAARARPLMKRRLLRNKKLVVREEMEATGSAEGERVRVAEIETLGNNALILSAYFMDTIVCFLAIILLIADALVMIALGMTGTVNYFPHALLFILGVFLWIITENVDRALSAE